MQFIYKAVGLFFLLLTILATTPIFAAEGNPIAYIVQHLDVNSFPDSVRPKIEKNKYSFSDYGLFTAKMDENSAQLLDKNKNWYYGVKILNTDAEGKTLLCLQKKALNGGSYNVQQPVSIYRDVTSEFLKVSRTKVEHPDCQQPTQ